MKEIHLASPNERPTLFDIFRKNYPVRREFHNSKLSSTQSNEELTSTLISLGFQKTVKQVF